MKTNIKAYQIRHKSTGLFYVPSREVLPKFSDGERGFTTIKSNLSAKGKVYLNRPPVPTGIIYNHTLVEKMTKSEAMGHLGRRPGSHVTENTTEDDWEIVVYHLVFERVE